MPAHSQITGDETSSVKDKDLDPTPPDPVPPEMTRYAFSMITYKFYFQVTAKSLSIFF